ncbi:MAG: response regulator transcription factor [Myxococcales bacterium]|nr:response regulator transcription factor [Myxococcales bacterium]
MTRVFVADDHEIICESLKAWVDTLDTLIWAGSAGDGESLLKLAAGPDPWDVLVLDLSLPGRSGVELLQEILTLRPGLRVIVFSMYPPSEYAAWALASGASAYISKSQPVSVLRDALLNPDAPAAAPLAKLPHESLSTREREVFLAIARGRTPSEIAWDLDMAPSTVSTHLKSMREKLKVRSTLEIAQYAARYGITGKV